MTDLDQALLLVNQAAIVTALLSGVALGWVFTVIRPGTHWDTMLRTGTAIGVLWYLPQMLTRLLDAELHVNGIRTIGPALLFLAFIVMGALTVALIDYRRKP